MNFNLIIIILTLTFLSSAGLTSQSIEPSLSFRVEKIYPSISYTKEELSKAQSISDINPYFKTSWIDRYKSVRISAWVDNQLMTKIGTGYDLTSDQKELFKKADLLKQISVSIEYIPNNNLTHNEPKIIDFKIDIDPSQNAEYAGGDDELYSYIKKNAIDHIPEGLIDGYKMAVISFVVDQDGRVTSPFIHWSSEDAQVDSILTKALCNMPLWSPARHENGVEISQEFALSIGDPKSCANNLLNTESNKLARVGNK